MPRAYEIIELSFNTTFTHARYIGDSSVLTVKQSLQVYACYIPLHQSFAEIDTLARDI